MSLVCAYINDCGHGLAKQTQGDSLSAPFLAHFHDIIALLTPPPSKKAILA